MRLSKNVIEVKMNHKNIRTGMILKLYKRDCHKMFDVEVLSDPYLRGTEYFVKVLPIMEWY